MRPEGRANPNQLADQIPAPRRRWPRLRETLVAAHRERFGRDADRDLYVGLQLTHSGRFARPHVKDRAGAARRLPPSRARPPVPGGRPPAQRRRPRPARATTSCARPRLAQRPASASSTSSTATATSATSCSARASAPGRYGGSFENRTRFLRERDRRDPRRRARARASPCGCPSSTPCPTARTRAAAAWPEASREGYDSAFGLLGGEDLDSALDDARALLRAARGAGRALDLHQRGQPVLQPARAAARALPAVRRLPRRRRTRCAASPARSRPRRGSKADFPRLVFVGSGYSYLQEWLPHVAPARRARAGTPTSSGLGRMVLSYPDLPADVLAGTAAPPQGHLPHLQRLHERAAHRPRLRLLSRSTRSTPRIPTRSGCARPRRPWRERGSGAKPLATPRPDGGGERRLPRPLLDRRASRSTGCRSSTTSS